MADPAIDNGIASADTTSRTGKRGKRVQLNSELRHGKRSQVECENDMLKRLIADLVLEKALLTERLRDFQTQE